MSRERKVTEKEAGEIIALWHSMRVGERNDTPTDRRVGRKFGRSVTTVRASRLGQYSSDEPMRTVRASTLVVYTRL